MFRSSSVRQHLAAPWRPRHRTVATLLAVATGSAVLALSAPATAHTDLEQASPEPGSKVSGGQAAVRLVFTEDIDLDLATVIVRAPSGENLAKGAPSSAGGAVLQPIGPFSTKGSYQVAYRVVSVDGHPIAGSYRFRVTEPARPAPAPSAAEAEPTATAPSPAPTTAAAQQAPEQVENDAAPAESQASPNTPLIGGGLILLLVIAGGAIMAWRRRATGPTPPAP